MAMYVNLALLAFLFSGLPLPVKLTDRIGLTPFVTESLGAPMRIAGGNLVQEYAAISLLGSGEGNPAQSTDRNEGEPDSGANADLVYNRYGVHGSTLRELESAITDPINGAGPYDEKEGKRYAAYVQADYEIEFQPVIQGFWREGNQMAVELGCRVNVRPKIRMYLPSFEPDVSVLKAACEAEEKRLEQHEMEHVAIFRLCGEKLQDTLINTSVIGKGPNIWVAMISAHFELGRAINRELDNAVDMANCMNGAVDVLTNHSLGLFK
jgi:hypothetical protein